MGPPAKKRKLNGDSKASPSAPRTLDFFFGKKSDELPIQSARAAGQSVDESTTELSDEELARKLQAEWNQEVAADGKAELMVENDIPDMNLSSAEIQEESELNSNGSAVPRMSAVTQGGGFLSPQSKGKKTLSLQSASSKEDAITSNIPFDESPLTFEPSKYLEDLKIHWSAEGGNATYALLTRCFVLVNSTQSRIKIVDTLVNLLRVIIEGDPGSLLPTVGGGFSFVLFYFSFYLSHIATYLFALFQTKCSDIVE